MTVVDLWDALRVGGLPLAIFLALIASMQGRFVWKREFTALQERLAEVERERDEWRNAFLRVAGVAEALTDLAAPEPRAREGRR